MRADHKVDLTGGDVGLYLSLLCRPRAADQQFDTVTGAGKQLSRVAKVLFGEDLGRGHQCGLISVFHYGKDRQERHDRLAAADVALDQTIHRNIGLEIGENLADHSLLGTCERERRQLLEPFASRIADLDDRAFRLTTAFAAQQLHRKRQPEKLVKDQPPMRRTPEHLVLGDNRTLGRKMYFGEGLGPRDKFVPVPKFGRQRV